MSTESSSSRKSKTKAGKIKVIEPGTNLLTLHDVFKTIGDRLTGKDVKMLKFVCSGLMPPEQAARVADGPGFLMALERIGRVDESFFRYLQHLLRIIGRHDLLHLLTLRKRKPGYLL
jgi:hypothetical protein